MPNIFDLGKRMCQRALFAVFACKIAQKFGQPHCGRLTLLLASLSLPRKPPRRGRWRVRFVPLGRRSRGPFRPSPSRRFFPPDLVIPRTAISVRIHCPSCCCLCPGSPLDALVGLLSPSIELASLTRTPPVELVLFRSSSLSGARFFRLVPARRAALPFRIPAPCATSSAQARRLSSWLLSSEPRPSPGFVRLDCGADRADGFLSNIECAVQREFAQDILLNRIGLGKGPFPLAVRGDSGSGVFEADRVVDLLRAERDHADPK